MPADWSNHANYALADEVQALKDHLNKVLEENKKLKSSNQTLEDLVKVWVGLEKSGTFHLSDEMSRAIVADLKVLTKLVLGTE